MEEKVVMESVACCLEIKPMCKAQRKYIFLQQVEGMSDFQAALCQKVLFPGRVLPCSSLGHTLYLSVIPAGFSGCLYVCRHVQNSSMSQLLWCQSPSALSTWHPPLLMIQQTLPLLKNSSCFQFKWQWMRNPSGVQSLSSSIAPQAELAWVTCHGVQAVVEMLDICQGHCSCWLAAFSLVWHYGAHGWFSTGKGDNRPEGPLHKRTCNTSGKTRVLWFIP